MCVTITIQTLLDSYGCCKRKKKLLEQFVMTCKSTILLSCNFRGQNPEPVLLIKSNYWPEYILLETLHDTLLHCVLGLLEASCIPWLVTHFHVQSQWCIKSFSHCLTHCDLICLPLFLLRILLITLNLYQIYLSSLVDYPQIIPLRSTEHLS